MRGDTQFQYCPVLMTPEKYAEATDEERLNGLIELTKSTLEQVRDLTAITNLEAWRVGKVAEHCWNLCKDKCRDAKIKKDAWAKTHFGIGKEFFNQHVRWANAVDMCPPLIALSCTGYNLPASARNAMMHITLGDVITTAWKSASAKLLPWVTQDGCTPPLVTSG